MNHNKRQTFILKLLFKLKKKSKKNHKPGLGKDGKTILKTIKCIRLASYDVFWILCKNQVNESW